MEELSFFVRQTSNSWDYQSPAFVSTELQKQRGLWKEQLSEAFDTIFGLNPKEGYEVRPEPQQFKPVRIQLLQIQDNELSLSFSKYDSQSSSHSILDLLRNIDHRPSASPQLISLRQEYSQFGGRLDSIKAEHKAQEESLKQFRLVRAQAKHHLLKIKTFSIPQFSAGMAAQVISESRQAIFSLNMPRPQYSVVEVAHYNDALQTQLDAFLREIGLILVSESISLSSATILEIKSFRQKVESDLSMLANSLLTRKRFLLSFMHRSLSADELQFQALEEQLELASRLLEEQMADQFQNLAMVFLANTDYALSTAFAQPEHVLQSFMNMISQALRQLAQASARLADPTKQQVFSIFLNQPLTEAVRTTLPACVERMQMLFLQISEVKEWLHRFRERAKAGLATLAEIENNRAAKVLPSAAYLI